jgi:hypothetical protein
VLIGIDHIVVAVSDLDAAAAKLTDRVGIAATGGGRHPQYGTVNRLAWLGDTFVELVTVVDRALAEQSWLGRPTLAAMDRGLDAFVTWALSTDDIDGDVGALRAQGAAIDDPDAGERVRADGRVVRWHLALRPTIGPDQPPFLIEHDLTGAEWTAFERAERAAEVHPIGAPVRLRAFAIPANPVGPAIQMLAREAGLQFRPSLAGGGARDATVGDHVVRLLPADRRVTVELASSAGDDRDVELFGIRWRVMRST